MDRGVGEDDDGRERAVSDGVAHAPRSRVDVGAVRAHPDHRAGLHVEHPRGLDDHGAHHRDGSAVVLPGDDPVVQAAVDVGITRGRRGARPREELLLRVHQLVGIVGIDVRAGDAAEGEQEHHRQRPKGAREAARARDRGHAEHPRHGRARRNDDVNAEVRPHALSLERHLGGGTSTSDDAKVRPERVRAVGRALVSRACVGLLATQSKTARESARDDARRACSARGPADAPREGARGVPRSPRYTTHRENRAARRTVWASWSEHEFNTSIPLRGDPVCIFSRRGKNQTDSDVTSVSHRWMRHMRCDDKIFPILFGKLVSE